MSRSDTELIETQVRLARLLEQDAKYFEAEMLIRSIWEEEMSPNTRNEIGQIFARVLRLRNKWDELESLLDSLLAAARKAGDTEQLAQLLVLRMEGYLCAYPNDPQACIDAADLLTSISQDSDLRFRAFGHKGLSYLALGDVARAGSSIERAIAVAEASGEPEASFLAWHFSSQLAIATLDLTTAVDIGRRLETLSEQHAVGREELFHLRDLGRAELLAGATTDAVEHLAQYLLVNRRSYERSRALAYLVMLVGEARQLVGGPAARECILLLRDAIAKDPDVGLSDSLGNLAEVLASGVDPSPSDFVEDQTAIEASWRIFCFNCDHLDEIREDVQSDGIRERAAFPPGIGAEDSVERPAIIVDLAGALSYFASSFVPLNDAALDGRISGEMVDALGPLAEHFDILVTKGAGDG